MVIFRVSGASRTVSGRPSTESAAPNSHGISCPEASVTRWIVQVARVEDDLVRAGRRLHVQRGRARERARLRSRRAGPRSRASRAPVPAGRRSGCRAAGRSSARRRVPAPCRVVPRGRRPPARTHPARPRTPARRPWHESAIYGSEAWRSFRCNGLLSPVGRALGLQVPSPPAEVHCRTRVSLSPGARERKTRHAGGYGSGVVEAVPWVQRAETGLDCASGGSGSKARNAVFWPAAEPAPLAEKPRCSPRRWTSRISSGEFIRSGRMTADVARKKTRAGNQSAPRPVVFISRCGSADVHQPVLIDRSASTDQHQPVIRRCRSADAHQATPVSATRRRRLCRRGQRR